MITIDYKDRTPIYQQIVERIEELAALGVLQPDSQIPPVRSLAMELAINPNTIQRAYADLEKKGVLYTVAGKGSFIAPATTALRQRKRGELFAQLARLTAEGAKIGVTAEEMAAECHRLYQIHKEEAGK